MVYVIDIDGTICSIINGEYLKAIPFYDRIKQINALYDWGAKYHQLFLGKPSGDFYIDDKGIKDKDFFADKVCS